MKRLLPILALVACSNADLEAERDAMASQLATLEKKLETTTQQKSALDRRVMALQAQLQSQQSDRKSEADRMQAELDSLTQKEIFRRLEIKKGAKLSAILHTSLGDVECVLFPLESPKTVLNFVSLAEGSRSWLDPRTREYTDRPLYDGVVFHRVIPGFMIQGGDPLGNGMGGPGYTFDDETDNGLGFTKEGLLAMANSGPNTNGSQFFITEGKRLPDHLNGKHTIFGDCSGAMDVVKTIAKTKTNRRKKPDTDVQIERIEIRR
jgi:peptidyl-prolyl cis-trans isomerase A (cyclophilin A)